MERSNAELWIAYTHSLEREAFSTSLEELNLRRKVTDELADQLISSLRRPPHWLNRLRTWCIEWWEDMHHIPRTSKWELLRHILTSHSKKEEEGKVGVNENGTVNE